MKKKTHFHVGYFIIAFFLIVGIQMAMLSQRQLDSLSYSQFQKAMADGKIAKIYIDSDFIYGDYDNQAEGKTRFITARVDPALAESLSRYDNVDINGVFHSNFLSWTVLTLLFFMVWYYGFRHVVEKDKGASSCAGSASCRE